MHEEAFCLNIALPRGCDVLKRSLILRCTVFGSMRRRVTYHHQYRPIWVTGFGMTKERKAVVGYDVSEVVSLVHITVSPEECVVPQSVVIEP